MIPIPWSRTPGCSDASCATSVGGWPSTVVSSSPGASGWGIPSKCSDLAWQRPRIAGAAEAGSVGPRLRAAGPQAISERTYRRRELRRAVPREEDAEVVIDEEGGPGGAAGLDQPGHAVNAADGSPVALPDS